ncbi:MULTISPECIES: ABC transporter permease [unclassified Rhizobium]|uniref:ABC transporter permease n=1 Tax=unclassified Rhizobium TaxID=2613769 RepID=UPI00160FB21A|nr:MULTISPECIES: ABC transporter permease [unclassified Rhizobium]MBB3545333.1 peptide/nickel transport system permease protein [Rhizobium sp. BK399]MCS3744093.1 peptide/nickel transport system permease protein [Rhizobium sp. BK661]MCS4096062.1 peptide/nickel transport system permease protein [Rhizobium sp. BK176]
MSAFLLSRILYAIAVIFGVSIAVFFLIRIGGDPSALFLPPEASAEEIARFRHLMGFDRSLGAQYLDFLGRALRGDFGMSLRYEQPAMQLVLDRVPATLELSGMALGLSLVVSIPLAIVAAAWRGSIADRASLLVSLIGQSFPAFWLAIMLILLFSETFHILPPSGRGGVRHLIMPAVVLATYSTAIITRLLRSSMIEVLQSDYIRTARGKGVSERRIVLKHALRNAAIPTLTVIGLQVGALLGGAVITEEVFAYPGIGRLAIQAISNRDFTVVQAFVLVMATAIVSINLLVDLSYGFLDPRLRKGK